MNVKSPDDALRILDRFQPLQPETVKLEEAGGRYLSVDFMAGEDVPAFDRSTMDGYAVRAEDTFGAGESMPGLLECKGEILMGTVPPVVVGPGECFQIHTGGMLPQGADAVLMVEDTEVVGTSIQCFSQVAPGENVIHRGEDIKKGDVVIRAGRKIRSPELGVLASLGVEEIAVHRRPVVGILLSGDEVVEWKTGKLEPGKIRDSNALAIEFMCRRAGAEVMVGGVLPDRLDAFMEKSRAMLEKVDFLVFSGGSSVGTRDFTGRAMAALGKPGLLVEGISVKPGKPTLIADCDGKPVLGLPGHPVSALTIFQIFGTRILQRLAGCKTIDFKPSVRAELSRNIPSTTGRTDYARIRLEKQDEKNIPTAIPVFGRSGMLRTLAEADGYLVVKAEKEGLSAGDTVDVYLIE